METTKHSRPWGADAFKMIDVGPKPVTFRRAGAQGKILLAKDAFAAIRNGTNPKGDVLALAEIAGIMASKKTSEIIPLCHPLPLDQVSVRFVADEAESSITVFCVASAMAKTGVEMEALCGVNGALLAIYDLSKAVNPVLSLCDIRLNFKEGGKSGIFQHPDHMPDPATEPLLPAIKCAVITVSDRASKGEREDTSGPAIVERLKAWGAVPLVIQTVPDEKMKIAQAIREAAAGHECRLVITTGGTGLSPRDVTPEALEEVCHRMIPGFGEHLRAEGSTHTELSWLSRSCAGLVDRTLVIALPGSPKAVKEGLQALEKIIPHALSIAQGDDHSP